MSQQNTSKQFLLNIAALIIIIAGIKIASALLIPFLLAIFITIICAPIMLWLQQFKVPQGLAVLIVFALFILIGMTFGSVISQSITEFYENLPEYNEKLQSLQAGLLNQLTSFGIPLDVQALKTHLNPAKAMGMVSSLFTSLGSMLTNTFLILFFVLFILMEVAGLPNKLINAFGENTKSITKFQQFSHSVKKYLVIKTLVSIGTGITVYISLIIIGVDYPVLWALMAFLLNFIPNIGSIIAAIPPLLLALVQFGPAEALAVALIFVAINTIFGNIVEPKVMGKTLGLSSFIVFTSLVFWGWVLGPVGMLLSIPLTMVFKIALENNGEYHWIAVLLDR